MKRAACVLLTMLAPLLAPGVRAQRAVTVRADNDAFNFWQYPWVRPDEEYTSGVRVSVEFGEAAAWAGPVRRMLGACPAGASACASHRYTVGQDIYTAVRATGAKDALPGGRPDAGVLWFSASTRQARAADFTEVGWTLGITGAPSLAESSQRFFHSIAPHYNRAIAWGRQLPAEPVFSAQVDRRRLATLGSLEVQPHAGASLGTLLTEVRGGLDVRLGRDLPHPWRATPVRGGLGVELVGGATVRGVLRNEVLSGTFFRQSARVPLRRVVAEGQGGVRLRWRTFEAAWLAHRTSAEYATRGTPHIWSTLEAAWRPGR